MARPPLSMRRGGLTAELDGYRELAAGWDGYDAAPVPESRIAAAERLLAALPDDVPSPHVGAASDGEVGVVWDDAESGICVDVDVWPDFDGKDRSARMCLLAVRSSLAEPERTVICDELDRDTLPDAAVDLLREIPTRTSPERVADRAKADLAKGDMRDFQETVTDILRFLYVDALRDRRQDWRSVALAFAESDNLHAARQGKVALGVLTWPDASPPGFPEKWRWAEERFEAARAVDPVEPWPFR